MNGTPPQAALADRQSGTGPRYMLSLLNPVSKNESGEGQAASHRNPSVCYSSALVFFGFILKCDTTFELCSLCCDILDLRGILSEGGKNL